MHAENTIQAIFPPDFSLLPAHLGKGKEAQPAALQGGLAEGTGVDVQRAPAKPHPNLAKVRTMADLEAVRNTSLPSSVRIKKQCPGVGCVP